MDDQLQQHINKETQAQINELKEHARVANEEMGVIKTDIAWLKKSVEDIAKKVDKVDLRSWWILGSVVLAALIQIIISLTNK